jgi:glycosyltransferase involved in cell wall biosynthesis
VRIWLITVGEPLPLPEARDRLLRAGLLAEILRARGHEVLWWTSTVDHFHKTRFVSGSMRVVANGGVVLQFLDGTLYRRNLSLARLRNHAQIGREFARLVRGQEIPDLILCSFPTIELSREAVRYGLEKGVPVVLDVRDLWPDIFVNVMPGWLRGVARFLLQGAFRDTAAAFARCTAVFAVSDVYLQWGLQKAQRAGGARDRVYPLGYRMSEFTSADENALDERLRSAGLDPRGALVSFVGTFGRTYDLDTVIRAAQSLAERGSSEAQLVFCGRGEREAEWRRAAAQVPRVAFIGWLPAGELACLLRRSAIGLAAYAAAAPQGIPNKVIEFLAAGLPVLCSLTGESRELLESSACGKYYEAGDARGLADRIQALLQDREQLGAMSRAAIAQFQSRFSATTVYGTMANDLEQLAREEKRPPDG